MDFLFNQTPFKNKQNQISRGARTGFAENFGAAYDEQVAVGMSISRDINVFDAVDERTAAIEKASGLKIDEWAKQNNIPLDVIRSRRAKTFDKHVRPFLTADIKGSVLSGDLLRLRGNEIALEKVQKSQEVMARAEGIGGVAGQLTGNMAGAVADPINIGAMLINPAGGAWRMIATDMALGTLWEGLIQIPVQDYRGELGLEHGFKQGLNNALLAGAGAAVLRGGVEGVKYTGRTLKNKMALLKDFKENVKNPTPEQKVSADTLEAETVHEASNPFTDTPKGREAHRKNMDAAEAHLKNGTIDELEIIDGGAKPLDDNNPFEVKDASEEVSSSAKYSVEDDVDDNSNIFDLKAYERALFDVENIKTDAKAFQYKSDGDATGVTERLEGVEHWDTMDSGTVLIWERKDGVRFIADGHQRLGLAKRLAKQDPTLKPKLNGFLLREIDGWTQAKTRIRAAAKNIREGSGTSIDAAKVMRATDLDLRLPPKSALARDSAGLSYLSDDAFGMVSNGIIKEKYGALIGSIAVDKQTSHGNIAKLLHELKPNSALEAELIIRDALKSPMVETVQTDMFGELISSMPLLKERALVMSRAIAQIKKDKAAFNTLVDEKTRLAQAGNKLNDAANKSRVSDDVMILNAIEKLANIKGELSNALNEAAKKLQENPNSKTVVSDFLEDLRNVNFTDKTNVVDFKPEPTAKAQMDALADYADDGGGINNGEVAAFEKDLRKALATNTDDDFDGQSLIDEIDREQSLFDTLDACIGGGRK